MANAEYIYTKSVEEIIKKAAKQIGWHPSYIVEIVGHPTTETEHFTVDDYISEMNKYFDEVGLRLLEPINIDSEGYRYSCHDVGLPRLNRKAKDWVLSDF